MILFLMRESSPPKTSHAKGHNYKKKDSLIKNKYILRGAREITTSQRKIKQECGVILIQWLLGSTEGRKDNLGERYFYRTMQAFLGKALCSFKGYLNGFFNGILLRIENNILSFYTLGNYRTYTGSSYAIYASHFEESACFHFII